MRRVLMKSSDQRCPLRLTRLDGYLVLVIAAVRAFDVRPTIERHLGTAAAAVGVAIITALAGCASLAPQGPRFDAHVTTELPRFTTPAAAHGRDAGFSAQIGKSIVWTFGDTFPNDDVMLSATAAYSTRDQPTHLCEPTDDQRVPSSLYRYTPEEQRYNTAHSDPPACCKQYADCPPAEPYCKCAPDTDCGARIALWPGAQIPDGNGGVVGFYEKVLVDTAPWTFDVLGVGTARIAAGETTAQRTLDHRGEAELVFGRGEPKFLHAFHADHRAGDWVYVYGETEPKNCGVDVFVGRVPRVRLEDRSAYSFWNGKEWIAELRAASPVLSNVQAGLGSVAWNDHLDAYVGATIGLCTDGAAMLLRSARRPQGPWSDPVVVDLSAAGADGEAYAGLIHPALGRGRRIVVSFYQPLVRDERAFGEVRLVELELSGRGGRPRARR